MSKPLNKPTISTQRSRKASHSTFSIERNYPKTPQQVFAAFADPEKKRRWFAEGEGFDVDSFEMDFRVGGHEQARFRFQSGAPIPAGTPCSNDTWYCDIATNERIVLAYVMTIGAARISSSLATFEFLPQGNGTRLVFTEQGVFFEGSDGPDIRKQGWQNLFEALAKELGA